MLGTFSIVLEMHNKLHTYYSVIPVSYNCDDMPTVVQLLDSSALGSLLKNVNGNSSLMLEHVCLLLKQTKISYANRMLGNSHTFNQSCKVYFLL